MTEVLAQQPLKIIILGLSITSSWGNGHATTYRGLVRALSSRGHQVHFLERDVPWYASSRDLPNPPYGMTWLYKDLDDLRSRFTKIVEDADLCIVGSYVPEGIEVGQWVMRTAAGVTAFYDIDTPVTLANLAKNKSDYINRDLLPRYDLYLSFSGGPVLEKIERQYESPRARALYCSVDPDFYFPESQEVKWDLGYLGTYSSDRQPSLELLMFETARQCSHAKMIVAGPMYPDEIVWPGNIEHRQHLPPAEHRQFYNSQRFTLNITRSDMIDAGYSPSVRLFEAAACETPIISDYWDGLDEFLKIGSEILVARNTRDVVSYLSDVSDEERHAIAERARARVLGTHTASARAVELERYVTEVHGGVLVSLPDRLAEARA